MSNPLCRAECTLPRGGDTCKGCGQTMRERYQWDTLSDEEKREVLERLKNYGQK